MAASLLYDDVADGSDQPSAYVALAVLAGIAAADVICIRKLGVYHHGQDHAGAVKLLSEADSDAAKALQRLLADKSKAEYSAPAPSKSEVRAARREHLRLVNIARAAA